MISLFKKRNYNWCKKNLFLFHNMCIKTKKQIIFRILENILKDIHVHDDYSDYTYVINTCSYMQTVEYNTAQIVKDYKIHVHVYRHYKG